MVDRFFSGRALSKLYDGFFPGQNRRDFDFNVPLVMKARAVLDVGCGTGALLHLARESGHKGRLCGVDPGAGMIEQARKRTDVEWLQGTLGSAGLNGTFELVVMTGHAFQVFLEDEELRVLLKAIRSAVSENGYFAFDTRNPLACEWERWSDLEPMEMVDSNGQQIRMACNVERSLTVALFP